MGMTIKELSKRCGLSVSAVSKALNGYPDVSEKTRQLVIKTAQEIGYFPNSLARGLKTNRTYNIGVVVDNTRGDSLLHHFFATLLNGFMREVEARGYDVTLISHNIGGQNLSFLNHCRYRNIDGVGLMCVDFLDQEIFELARSDIPLVSVDHLYTGKECVLSDNRSGMRQLLEYIIGKGHRRIAYLHGATGSVTDARVGAFFDVMEEHGLRPLPGFVSEATYNDSAKQYDDVQRLLKLPERPTCIIMTDDNAAMGGIEALQQAGLRVPEDISVAGYDGVPLIQKMRPRLTTLRQNASEMGRRAAIRLVNRIDTPDAALTAPDIVPGELVAGETVAQI